MYFCQSEVEEDKMMAEKRRVSVSSACSHTKIPAFPAFQKNCLEANPFMKILVRPPDSQFHLNATGRSEQIHCPRSNPSDPVGVLRLLSFSPLYRVDFVEQLLPWPTKQLKREVGSFVVSFLASEMKKRSVVFATSC
jgi:hypothetical protein